MLTKEQEQDVLDFLEHHGVKGMHWGIRQSKKKTGISRSRGILLDRNALLKNNIELAKQGDKFRISSAIGRKFIGKEQQTRNWNQTIANLNAQDKRLKSKKKDALTFLDKVDMTTHWNVIDALVTTRPGKKK